MYRLGRTAVGIVAVSVAIGDAARAEAGQGIEVERWLDRAGVRMVAVEFYATWCKPCMKAVPRWKALHEKYRKDGLRLIVVAVRDLKSGCSDPGWTPDAIVCDDDGVFAERYGARDLPAAFLWTWQGDLLVSHGHVEEVEAKVAGWFKESPAVAIHVEDMANGSGLGHGALWELLRQDLGRRQKLRVALTDAEKNRILKLRAEAAGSGTCEAGQGLTARSVLEASVRRTSERMRLQLSLLSAEKGCQEAAATVGWDPATPDSSVAEALDQLMGALRPEVQYPWGTERREVVAARPVVQPPKAPDGYDDIEARVAQAEQRDREEAAAHAARAAQAKELWPKVKRLSETKGVPADERVQRLEKFLADFGDDNPHAADARARIEAIRGEVKGTEMVAVPAGAFPGGNKKPAESTLPAQLDDDEILQVLKKKKAAIKACVEKQAKEDPNVEGAMTVSMVIQNNGKTTRHMIGPEKFNGTFAARCVLGEVKAWTFGQFSGPPMPIDFPVRLGP